MLEHCKSLTLLLQQLYTVYGKVRGLEAVAKLQPMEKTMILSQFASHEVAKALPPSTYSGE